MNEEEILKKYYNRTLKIDNKSLMYWLLNRGLLGNNFRIFKSEKELFESGVTVCGIRAVGKKTGLEMVPWTDPEIAYKQKRELEEKYNCEYIVCECDKYIERIIQGEFGFIEGQGWTFYYTYDGRYMRQALKENGYHVFGEDAWRLLRMYANEESYNDMYELIHIFPGHIFEWTIYKECVGWARGRNYVTWEVREY